MRHGRWLRAQPRGPLSFLLGAIALTAPLSATQPEPEGEELPAFLVEALAREGELSEPQGFELLDGMVKLTAPAKVLGRESYDGYDYVQLGVDSEFPIECYVYDNEMNVAALLQELGDRFVTLLAEPFGGVLWRQIQAMGGGLAAGVPYLAAEWWYTAGAEESPQVGALKLATAGPQELGVVCSHGELGYRETFVAVVETLLGSLVRTRGAPSQPLFREVSLVTMQGLRVGYSETTIDVDDEGDFQYFTRQAMAIPVDETTLSATDSATSEWAGPDGLVINRTTVEAENGEITMNLSLLPLEADRWRVEGTFQGKELQASIAPSAPSGALTGEFAILLAARDLLDKPRADRQPVVLRQWQPDADPTAPTEVAIRPADGERSFVLDLSGIEVQVTTDEFGNPVRMEAVDGAMLIERVLHQGQAELDAALEASRAARAAADAAEGR